MDDNEFQMVDLPMKKAVFWMIENGLG